MHSTFVDSTTWTLFIHWLWDPFIFEAWTWSTYFVTNTFYIKVHPRLASFKHLYTQKYLFLNIYLFDVELEFASMLNNYNLYCIRNNSVWKSLREFSDLHLCMSNDILLTGPVNKFYAFSFQFTLIDCTLHIHMNMYLRREGLS